MLDEWLRTEVDLSDNITTILAIPALVKGVYVNAALSAHDCPIMDGTTQANVIPAGAVVGNAYAFGPARYETKLIVDPNDAATGKISVVYKDLARHN